MYGDSRQKSCQTLNFSNALMERLALIVFLVSTPKLEVFYESGARSPSPKALESERVAQ